MAGTQQVVIPLASPFSAATDPLTGGATSSGGGSGSGVSAMPISVAFSTTIPLDGLRYMPRQSVSGALAFTAGTIKPGGVCTVALISNGTNAPTFSGMVEDSSSQGWLSTANAVNILTFWADDTTVYYSVHQAAVPQFVYPPATAYTLSGPATSSVGSTTTYTVVSNGALASAVVVTPSDGGSGGTFTPTTVTLAAGQGTSASFTYAPSATGAKTISTTNNGGLTNPASINVTVSAAATFQNLRLTGVTGMTEAVDASPPVGGASGTAYDYTPTTTGTYGAAYAISAVAVPANADGYFGATNKVVGATGLIVGFKTSSTSSSFNNVLYGLYADTTGSKTTWQVLGSSGGTVTAVTLGAMDVARIRRSGTTVVAEVSKDSGATYTAVYTWTGVSTAALYGHFQGQNAADPIVQPFASGNAA